MKLPADQDVVECKRVVIAQLHKKSDDFVEGWKEEVRRERAEILGNRQRLMSDIGAAAPKARRLKSASSVELGQKSTEDDYQRCLAQLKQQADTEIVEDWKAKACETRRLIFATRHQLVNQIAQGNPAATLKTRKRTFSESRKNVLAEIKKSGDVVPEWKQQEINSRINVIESRNQVIQDLCGKGAAKCLKHKDGVIEQRAKVLEGIRKENPVEAWRQNGRDQLAVPMVQKQQMLTEMCCDEHKLKCTKNKRVELFNEIKSLNQDEVVPEWKEKQQNQRREMIELKHSIACQLADSKPHLHQKPNHVQLMADIRQTHSADPTETTFTEQWRQTERDQRANAIQAKNSLLVSLEQEKVKLKQTAVASPKSKVPSHAMHMAVMNELRTEPVEAWKERLHAERATTIQNKKCVQEELELGKQLTVANSPQENKIFLLSELRAVKGEPVEGWKEVRMNFKAKQLGNKVLLHEALKSKTPLKATMSLEKSKIAAMKELRGATGGQIPMWLEEERDERAIVQNNRHALICQIPDHQPKLTPTKSLLQTKQSVLSDIRRNEPLEAWREQERNTKAALFTTRRAVNSDIETRSRRVSGSRTQSALKEEMLREIRKVGEQPVPAWKEEKMQARLDTIKNKVQLNLEICSMRR